MRQGNATLIKYIIHSVAEYYQITDYELCFGGRHRIFSEPRQVAAYCIYRFAEASYPAIAALFGKKSHANIMYAVAKVEEWRDNPALNRKAVRCIQHVLEYN